MGTLPINPIIGTHVGGTTDLADLFCARLGAFLDEEASRLQQLSRLLELPKIPRLLATLGNLHRGPRYPDRAVLAETDAVLAELLDVMRGVPFDAAPTGPVLPGDESLLREIDAAIRWCGARVEEQRQAIMYLAG